MEVRVINEYKILADNGICATCDPKAADCLAQGSGARTSAGTCAAGYFLGTSLSCTVCEQAFLKQLLVMMQHALLVLKDTQRLGARLTERRLEVSAIHVLLATSVQASVAPVDAWGVLSANFRLLLELPLAQTVKSAIGHSKMPLRSSTHVEVVLEDILAPRRLALTAATIAIVANTQSQETGRSA